MVPDIKSSMLEENNVREGFLEHEQYILLRDELPDHQRLILVIGYHLGMRRGEILNLRWDQVDWDANIIRLEKKQTKGKQARVAPLYGELRAWLDMAYARARRIAHSSFPGRVRHQRGENRLEQSAGARWRTGTADSRPAPDSRAQHDPRWGIEKQVLLIVGWRTRAMLDRYNITDERDIQVAAKS